MGAVAQIRLWSRDAAPLIPCPDRKHTALWCRPDSLTHVSHHPLISGHKIRIHPQGLSLKNACFLPADPGLGCLHGVEAHTILLPAKILLFHEYSLIHSDCIRGMRVLLMLE